MSKAKDEKEAFHVGAEAPAAPTNLPPAPKAKRKPRPIDPETQCQRRIENRLADLPTDRARARVLRTLLDRYEERASSGAENGCKAIGV